MTLTHRPNGALIESETTAFVPHDREDDPEAELFGTTFNLASVGRYVHKSTGQKMLTIWGGGAIERQAPGEDLVTATYAVKQGYPQLFIPVPRAEAIPSATFLAGYRSRV